MKNKVLQVICAILILGILVCSYTAGIYSGTRGVEIENNVVEQQ